MLRDYQDKAIKMTYSWLERNPGNPCIVLPTGSGKSHVIAELCRDAIRQWADTRILMLSHVKEILEQNAEKMLAVWPEAPLGIYSAGIGQKEINRITFAGIQSIYKHADKVGEIDLLIIDEAHTISHNEQGIYRSFIGALQEINPHVRIIGLTASPYRLGHGLITEKPALFDALIEPTSILDLIGKGYLSRLISKQDPIFKIDVSGVHKRGGEYIEKELQEAVNNDKYNHSAIEQTLARAGNRKSWLFFCSGVAHAERINELLQEKGIKSACVLGSTPKEERESILARFKAGEIQAVTNNNVLTTGFDAPNIDLIVMLRPTMSPGLYLQMAGRGLRIAPDKQNCLVLDFAGVVEMHGPITHIVTPGKGGNGTGEAPTKVCPECQEILHLSAKECSCGYVFPEKEKVLLLRENDIIGKTINEMKVRDWRWRPHTSLAGNNMIRITYYSADYSAQPIHEYLTIFSDGFAGETARKILHEIELKTSADISKLEDGEEIAKIMNKKSPPHAITYVMDGKYPKIKDRAWKQEAVL